MSVVYLDESVLGCILGGVLVALGVAWAVWGAVWVRRVELRAAAEPLVREFGLAWGAEGLGARVSARGKVGAQEVEVRVSVPVDAPRFRARVGAAKWEELDRAQPAAALRARLGV